jgi:hypothetical protein
MLARNKHASLSGNDGKKVFVRFWEFQADGEMVLMADFYLTDFSFGFQKTKEAQFATTLSLSLSLPLSHTLYIYTHTYTRTHTSYIYISHTLTHKGNPHKHTH